MLAADLVRGLRWDYYNYGILLLKGESGQDYVQKKTYCSTRPYTTDTPNVCASTANPRYVCRMLYQQLPRQPAARLGSEGPCYDHQILLNNNTPILMRGRPMQP